MTFRILYKTFQRNDQGNIALVTALLGIPLVLGVTFTLDYQQALRETNFIQSALDAAALSTVSNATLSDAQREPYARNVFETNYTGELEVDLTVDAKAGSVKLYAEAERATVMGELLNAETIKVRRGAHAKLRQEEAICLLTLDPESKGSLTVSGQATLSAPNCAVQVNSAHVQAMVSNGGGAPMAKRFCAVGGIKGNFLPYADSECTAVQDPYKAVPIPERGPCIDLLGGGAASGAKDASSTSARGAVTTNAFETEGGGSNGRGAQTAQNVSDNITLWPGTYCGGLTYSGERIRLNPGVYHIVDGPLVFEKSAEVSGENLTFILQGQDSSLQIEQGSIANIKASYDGDYGGVAFYQVPSGTGMLPEGTSTFKSGGRMNITGVMYFPTHDVELKGKSDLGSHAPAMSFIAYNLSLSGQVNVQLNADYQKAGLPPLMPRSDAGPVLVH